MISLARLRGEVSFTFFSSLGELVQGSALFWLWLHLGSTFLLVVEPDSWKGFWVGEDGIGVSEIGWFSVSWQEWDLFFLLVGERGHGPFCVLPSVSAGGFLGWVSRGGVCLIWPGFRSGLAPIVMLADYSESSDILVVGRVGKPKFGHGFDPFLVGFV